MPHNPCAGPFGAVYDVYIERPWLTYAIGRLVWGSDTRPMYASMEAIGRVWDGATIVDVPCGGGVALRALRPEQRVRYVAGDLEPAMLERVRARAAARGLTQVETVDADMRALPLADASAELFCSYSGLHMVLEPARAVAEIARLRRSGRRATWRAGCATRGWGRCRWRAGGSSCSGPGSRSYAAGRAVRDQMSAHSAHTLSGTSPARISSEKT